MQHVRLAGGAVLLAVALTTAACSSDSSGDDAAPEPAQKTTEDTTTQDTTTLAGACSMLLGPGGRLADDALTAGVAVVTSGGATRDVDRATEVQNKIFTIVAEGPATVQDPAGQLVDYLDDPVAYQTKGEVDPLVTDAVATLTKVCAS